MDLLKIPINEPAQIFPIKEDELHVKYRELMKQYHPDLNKSPEAVKISSHIGQLYENAQQKLKDNWGVWYTENGVILIPRAGSGLASRKINGAKRRKFELGEMIYGDNLITYIVHPEYKKLVANYLGIVKNLSYANDDMKKEIGRYLPTLKESFETSCGHHIVILQKTPDVFLLQDVLELGEIDPKHVAWIMSRMFNLCCYLNYAGLVHNNFSPMTCWISPEHHTVCLYGGWWYSAKQDSPLTILPSRSIKYLSNDMIRNKKADKRADLSLIRVLGRELLGDISGMNLYIRKDLPEPMRNYLKGVSGNDPVEEFKTWKDKILLESFGPRKFVQMNINRKDVYKELL